MIRSLGYVMNAETKRAIEWVHGNAASFGGDSNRIWLGGHSSGSHLAGVALTTLQPGIVKSSVGVLGVHGRRKKMDFRAEKFSTAFSHPFDSTDYYTR